MIGLALVVAVITSLVFVGTRSGGSPAQGPLVSLLRGRMGIGVPLRVGQSASVSGTMIRNNSDHPVSLDKIEPVGARGDPIIVGAYLSPPPGNLKTYGYKVPANGRAIPGATLAPHETAELVVGVKAKQGRWSFSSFNIVYHGPGNYRRHAAVAVAVCAPVAKYLYTCNAPRPS